MKPGSVIVDLAVEQGGNCALSEPGKVVAKHGVKIVGRPTCPAGIAGRRVRALRTQPAELPARPLVDKETKALKIDWDDEIVKGVAADPRRQGRASRTSATERGA